MLMLKMPVQAMKG